MFAFFTVLRGKLGTLMAQNDWHFLSHTHTQLSLTWVAHYDDTRECSLQPQAAEVMRSVDLILSSSPYAAPESQGRALKKKEKEPLFLPQCVLTQGGGTGVGWRATYTPPAIKSLEFVFPAQKPSAKREETSRLGGKCQEGIRRKKKTCENEDVCHRILFTGCRRTVTLHPEEV